MVLTAPLAIIKVGGVPIGKMRNVTINEVINRAPIRGIGSFNPSEYAPLTWDGNITAGMYLIDFKRSLNKLENAEVLQRAVNTVEDFVNTVLLQEEGLQLDILRKVKTATGPTGIIQADLEIFASVRGCFITRESMDISEGQVTGRNADFSYTTPIIYAQ
jgi:hypothetical protein